MPKLHRIVTIPESLATLLKGQPRFMQQYYDVTIISSGKELLKKIGETEGVKYYPVELTRQMTPIKDLKALWRLFRYFRKEKPDIVHTHTPKAGLIGMIAAYLSRVPHRLHTVAGLPLLETSGLKRKILNFVEKVTCFCATKIYPNSFHLQRIIIENGFCPKNKLKVIANGSSNGIDTVHFSSVKISKQQRNYLKTELSISENDTVFCFVGRLVNDKGINELVTSFSQLSTFNPQLSVKLLLVGPFERELDPLQPETEKEIHNNPNIIYVGFQADVRPYLAISDIFVFPSYREGFPNAVMQAGAMELPCIVTDINGCNEIIEDGVNGLIIPTKNKEQLKEKMQLLQENSDLRNQLKKNARSIITSRYEQKTVWEALLEEYKLL